MPSKKSKTKKEENLEPVVEEEPDDPKAERKSMIYVLAAIGFFIVIVVLIFVFSDVSRQTIDTPNEMYLEVVKEGETDYGYMYDDFVFIKYAGSWMTRLKSHITGRDYDVPLRYGPRDVESVAIEGNPFAWILTTINRTQFYLTFDPIGEEFKYLALGSAELSANMAQVAGILPIAACTNNESDACIGIPIITCENTDVQVVYIIDSEGPPKITKKENCLILEGKDFDLLKAIDRLLYIWYGVMPPTQISIGS